MVHSRVASSWIGAVLDNNKKICFNILKGGRAKIAVDMNIIDIVPEIRVKIESSQIKNRIKYF